MRLGNVMWSQVIELRSRNRPSHQDDERLAAIFRWVLPYYYGWHHAGTKNSHDLTFRSAAKSPSRSGQGQARSSPSPQVSSH